MTHTPTIGLVDDEPEMLRALRRLLLGEGFHVRTFGSAEDFLQQFTSASLDCVVLDVSMPGLGGLDVQERLNQAGAVLPVIFLTGRGDIPTSVRAIKAGAVNFLTKPVERAELLAALRVALTEGGSAAPRTPSWRRNGRGWRCSPRVSWRCCGTSSRAS
jgi:FixJ family two-component response regulator